VNWAFFECSGVYDQTVETVEKAQKVQITEKPLGVIENVSSQGEQCYPKSIATPWSPTFAAG
jgi:hypothetical protein